MDTIKQKLGYPDLWYKLYADDLVLVVPQGMVQTVLDTLIQVSQDFNLTVNRKKSGIFLHNKRFVEGQRVLDFPILKEYCYLGVVINHRGSIKDQILRIEKRSKYLTSVLKFFIKDLSFQNQFLIWTCYVRPYF